VNLVQTLKDSGAFFASAAGQWIGSESEERSILNKMVEARGKYSDTL